MAFPILAVGLRVIASPLLNVVQKKLTQRGVSSLFIVFVSYVLITILCLGKLFQTDYGIFSTAFIVAIILAGVLDALGNVFLVKSLEQTDLSVFGPINAYKAIVSLGVGVVVLGEVPTLQGLLGVLIILVGSYFLYFNKESRGLVPVKKLLGEPGVWYRILAMVVFAVAAVYLKKAILLSDPMTTFVLWAALGAFTLLLAMLSSVSAATLKKNFFVLKSYPHFLISAAVLFAGMQLFTLFAFQRLLVGYSLALFQLSAVIAVFFGFKFFGEKNIRNRLIGSTIMVVGAVLILYSAS